MIEVLILCWILGEFTIFCKYNWYGRITAELGFSDRVYFRSNAKELGSDSVRFSVMLMLHEAWHECRL